MLFSFDITVNTWYQYFITWLYQYDTAIRGWKADSMPGDDQQMTNGFPKHTSES